MFTYLDGECTPTERSRLEAHLADCAACERELAERRKIIELIKTADITVPESLHANVMALVGATPQERRSLTRFIPRGGLTKAIGGVAAACAVALVVMLAPGMTEPNTDLTSEAASGEPNPRIADVVDEGYSTETIEAARFSSPMTTDADEQLVYSTTLYGASTLDSARAILGETPIIICDAQPDRLAKPQGAYESLELDGVVYEYQTLAGEYLDDLIEELDEAKIAYELDFDLSANKPEQLYVLWKVNA